MKAIVAVDNNWGIGKNNGLLFKLKADMRYFKEKTLGKVVVMGSNTLLSFPNSKPLCDRTNIVLFPGGSRDDCIVAQNLPELFGLLKEYLPEDVFIVGGAMFYKTMLPYCTKVYVTKVEADGGATVFFENLDALENWKCVSVSDPVVDGDYTIRFTEYVNNKPLSI